MRYNGGSLSKSPLRPLQKDKKSEESFEVALERLKYILYDSSINNLE